ncbi:MAG TPA: carbonic anhydrase [Verrucomicrobiae bacterium]|jgi:carbonic anhydrase
MRLFEEIVQANQRGVINTLSLDGFVDSLPVVALTCIDPRLNRLLPESLGLPEDQFIWLRNAGNIIFDPMSSMMRTLALGCAIKGGREIAIIGHTDCRVRQVSMVELTDRFKKLGIERSQLPENINEFFGLFASERQNVIRGVEFTRQSPIIGPKIPVHGLLIDIETGRLEWVVNGYDALASVGTRLVAENAAAISGAPSVEALSDFKIGEIKMREMQIGDAATKMVLPSQTTNRESAESWASAQKYTPASATPVVSLNRPAASGAAPVSFQAPPPPPPADASGQAKLDRAATYRVVGDDRKIYGPVSAEELERWIAENRIDLKTLAQKVGQNQWKALEHFVAEEAGKIPLPPTIAAALEMAKDFKRKR